MRDCASPSRPDRVSMPFSSRNAASCIVSGKRRGTEWPGPAAHLHNHHSSFIIIQHMRTFFFGHYDVCSYRTATLFFFAVIRPNNCVHDKFQRNESVKMKSAKTAFFAFSSSRFLSGIVPPRLTWVQGCPSRRRRPVGSAPRARRCTRGQPEWTRPAPSRGSDTCKIGIVTLHRNDRRLWGKQGSVALTPARSGVFSLPSPAWLQFALALSVKMHTILAKYIFFVCLRIVKMASNTDLF